MIADNVVRIALARDEYPEVHAFFANRRDHRHVQFAEVGVGAIVDPVLQIKTVLDVVFHTRLSHNGELKISVCPEVSITQRRHDVVA